MSKNKLTILLFAIVIALTSYSFWRISIPRVLSIEEMKVNGFYKYGDSQEVREFELKDHNNNIFTKKNLKKHEINFIYFGYTTCPTECPVMMSVMRQLFEKIDTDDIAFYLISFDPEIDTIERLKKYVTAFNDDFIGVSGEQSEVLKLGYQLGIEKLEPVQNHMSQRVISHTNHLVLVDNDANIMGIFKGPFDSRAMSLVTKSLLQTN